MTDHVIRLVAEAPARLGRPRLERTMTELKVTGSIPRELDGRYLRNDANPLSGMSAHPFFGDGMVHGVR